MSDVRDAAIHFEGVKIALTQSKEGLVLKLAVHPSDVPRDVILDSLGTRYIVAMVKVNDSDEPEKGADKAAGDRAIAAAGLLCRNDRFCSWMHQRGFSVSAGTNDVASGLRVLLGVDSRRELATNETARNVFFDLKAEFEEDFRKGNVPK